MTIQIPQPHHLSQLRSLWKEAFGDADAFLDVFYATGFSPERCRCICLDGTVAAALYWFDWTLEGRKIAYLYAVATRKAFRHRGLARELLDGTHLVLQQAGYSGSLLTPARPELFAFYERSGYGPASTVRDRMILAGAEPVPLREIGLAEYLSLRPKLLPAGSAVPDEAYLSYLAAQTRFYRGRDFLICAAAEQGILTVQEYLGDWNQPPGILAALGCQKGRFLGPGSDRVLTMYRPLDAHGAPHYCGFPMD